MLGFRSLFVRILTIFTQFDKRIHRHCTPPDIVIPAVNRTGTAGTGFEVMYRYRFNNVSALFALDGISDDSHKITPIDYTTEFELTSKNSMVYFILFRRKFAI